jgi:hypothetical protein
MKASKSSLHFSCIPYRCCVISSSIPIPALLASLPLSLKR